MICSIGKFCLIIYIPYAGNLEKYMIDQNMSIIYSFIIYLLFMLGIGAFFYRRTHNLSDYILGGRGLNSWVTSLSAQASDMSGWLLLGLPGYAYLAGMESLWMTAGLALGTWLNWKFIAARLRRFTHAAGDAITLPVFFENRLNAKSPALRIVSALFILIFFLIYTASGFVAGAKLFNTVFGFNYQMALTIGVLVIIGYTFLGGFWAVSWTDFFQGSIMFIAILTVPWLAIRALHGVGPMITGLNGIPGYLDPFHTQTGQSISLISILSLAGWGLGYFGQPHILARFMAIRHESLIPKARFIAMNWVILCLLGATLVGLTGRALLVSPLDGAASETVFMVLVNDLVHTWFAGFLLAAILAAIMSTADSQLLVASSAVTEDLYRLLVRRNAGNRELLWISRSAVIIIALIAYVIALNPESMVLDLVSYAWAGFGATFGPVILFSLYWKRMTLRGALAGMITGGIIVIVWKQLDGGLFDLYEIIPGFVLSMAAIIIFSYMDQKPGNRVDQFFELVRN